MIFIRKISYSSFSAHPWNRPTSSLLFPASARCSAAQLRSSPLSHFLRVAHPASAYSAPASTSAPWPSWRPTPLRPPAPRPHMPSAPLSLSLPTGPARQPAPLTFLFFPDASLSFSRRR